MIVESSAVKQLFEEAIQQPATVETSNGPVDFVVNVGKNRFFVEVKSDARSASVASAIRQLEILQDKSSENQKALLSLIVRHMGSAGADLCRQNGISWLDLDGNAEIEAPNLRIRIIGQSKNNSSKPLESQQGVNPFATKASRIVHALLLQPREIWTPAKLRSLTKLDKGSISRTISALQAGGYLTQSSTFRSAVIVKDPQTLLDAWEEHFRSRPTLAYGLLSTRDGSQTEARVQEVFETHEIVALFGGLSAAASYTKFGSFRRVRVYVENELSPELRTALNVANDSRGRNIVVVRDDGGAKIGSTTKSRRQYTSPILTYLDLQSEGERSEEARDELRRMIAAQWK